MATAPSADSQQQQQQHDNEQQLLVVILVSSAAANAARRRALRRTWWSFATTPNPRLSDAQRAAVALRFVVSAHRGGGGGGDCAGASSSSSSSAGASAAAAAVRAALEAEHAQHGDLLLLNEPEGYEHLWRKALASLRALEAEPPPAPLRAAGAYHYYMHADDDSYVRLDLLVPLLQRAPRRRLYWGYVWDGEEGRATRPIRDARNKSHMPVEQYPDDAYPPFASGCGFVLSRDLVLALLRQPLPDYRLLDPPFGIHLCGGGERCVLTTADGGPVAPVHEPRVRPYRGIPIFRADTLVQHYLRPEEMAPFHAQALAALGEGEGEGEQQAASGDGAEGGSGGNGGGAAASSSSGAAAADKAGPPAGAPEQLYAQLVAMGLLRR